MGTAQDCQPCPDLDQGEFFYRMKHCEIQKDKEIPMSKMIGHNTIRDPYPWDGAEVLANAASWRCCGMNLPATYYLCPICDKQRDLEQSAAAGNTVESMS